MDAQALESALRSALDEVEKAHAIIQSQKKDRDALRERLKWVSDRALFYGLASASEGVKLTEQDYGALLATRPGDSATWASLCASRGADPAGGITVEQFSGHRTDPHADLESLADLPVLRRAVRTVSEATPRPALPGLTDEKRAQLQRTVGGVLREIVKTEQDYVEALRGLVDDFYRPLLDSSYCVDGAVLDSENVHKIFGNVEDILLISEELLHVLHTRIAVEGQRKVSDIFLNMGFAFKLYSRYIIRYEEASVTLRDVSQSNERFCQWLIDTISFAEACNMDPSLARHYSVFSRSGSELQLNSSAATIGSSRGGSQLQLNSSIATNLSDAAFDEVPTPDYPRLPLALCLQKLSDQLMKPVQRVIRYQMLVEELHKNTARLGEPTVDLELCLARLRGVNDFNNEEIRVNESKDKLHKLQARLGGRLRLVGSQVGPGKLVKFQHHIREQELIKVHGKGDRRTAPCHLALLTDELIYSRPVESRKFELRLHARIPIEPASTRFEDIPDEDEEGKSGGSFTNRIAIISAKRTFIVFCPGPNGAADKEDWLEDLNRAQHRAREATGQEAEAYHRVAITQPVYEADGPECSLCNSRFGVLRRRHHCRLCGALVCDSCASSFADLRKLNRPHEQDQVWGSVERVCDDCTKWANIFYQDYLRFIPVGNAADTQGESRLWITPVVQKVQETRVNQRAERDRKRAEMVVRVATEEVLGTDATEQEEQDEEARQARVKAAWRYAMRHAVDQDFHHGSQNAGSTGGGGLGGLWSGWLWKRGGGTTVFGRQNWKRRWFVLTNEQLAYYESVEELVKMSRPGHADTAKGKLYLRDYTIGSLDRDLLRCVMSSQAGGREFHMAKCDPSSEGAIAAITTRDREDFLMLVSVLQGLLEVIAQQQRPPTVKMSRERELEKKELAMREAEFYAQQTQATHDNLQAIQQQIQQQHAAAGGSGSDAAGGHTGFRKRMASTGVAGGPPQGRSLPQLPPRGDAPAPADLVAARTAAASRAAAAAAAAAATLASAGSSSPVADCPPSLRPFTVVFGAQTAEHLGINFGLRLGGAAPDLAQYSCCIEYFVRMEDGTDGPGKMSGKVRRVTAASACHLHQPFLIV